MNYTIKYDTQDKKFMLIAYYTKGRSMIIEFYKTKKKAIELAPKRLKLRFPLEEKFNYVECIPATSNDDLISDIIKACESAGIECNESEAHDILISIRKNYQLNKFIRVKK